jgi:hypothetical protein
MVAEALKLLETATVSAGGNTPATRAFAQELCVELVHTPLPPIGAFAGCENAAP